MWSAQTIQLIRLACEEDLGRAGDITSSLLAQPDAEVAAHVIPRVDGVICGLALGPQICDVFAERLATALAFAALARAGASIADGSSVRAGETVATVRGPRAALLAVERTLLNFMARMSGVATLTRRYVEAARPANPKVQILDTRKTIPGWRELDKYAVRAGGGVNHRLGLHDAVLIKDNHLAGVPLERLASTLSDLLARIEGEPKFVEVEVDRLEQLAEVGKVDGVDVVLLDNCSLDHMRAAVEYRDSQGLHGRLALEASGTVTLENVAQMAATGVDRISVGALTHSAPSLDIGLDL
jgi:nicotinate-nucleotide pyrophosphorylase (carboxylating)